MSSQKHECGVKYFPGFKNYGAPSKGIEKTPGVLVMGLEHIWGLLSFSAVLIISLVFSCLDYEWGYTSYGKLPREPYLMLGHCKIRQSLYITFFSLSCNSTIK